MKTLSEQLVQYAAYHRDARNIATHFVGIPLIVLAVSALLSRPQWEVGGIPCSPAVALVVTLSAYYLSLDVALGLIMSALMAAATVFGGWCTAQETLTWLSLGVGGFVVGWCFQIVGHIYEGRKPAFVDDLMGLAIGPLFVLVEMLFKLGLLEGLQAEIEQRAGKVRGRKAQTA